MTKQEKWKNSFFSENNIWIDWVIFILLAIVWGSSFKLMKEGLKSFSSVQVACGRITAAGLAFLPILIYNIKKIKFENLKFFVAVGFLGSFIPAFCFTTAQKYISSSDAGILNSLTPLFSVLTGFLLFKDTFPNHKVIGIILGFVGALLMILFGKENALHQFTWSPWTLLVVLATLFYGINVNVVKHYLSDVPSPIINSVALFFVLIPSSIILFSTDFLEILKNKEGAAHSFKAICILGILGTAMSGYLFFVLIKRRGVIFGVMVTYLMPIVALLWGIYDKEVISIFSIFALVLILFSIYLVNKTKN